MSAVAAREPPNSARSGGKNTGKLFPMPPTSIMIANATQRRALARLSEGAGGATASPSGSASRAAERGDRGAGSGPHVGHQIFAPAFAQSSRNFFRPMSVSGCLMSCSRTANGIVATCAPALAASITWSGLRMDAASTCVAKP